MALDYPFVPKSNEHLHAGQFFGVPLSSGRYAAGRVLTVPAFGADDRKGFVVGLMDWVGDVPPTAADMARRRVLEQAKTTYLSITKTGGAVLGERDLGVFNRLGTMDPYGKVVTVWGWQTIQIRAEERFEDHPELHLTFFADFPSRRRAEGGALKLKQPGEVREVPGGWRVVGTLVAKLPLDLAVGRGEMYANMIGGRFAGTEPSPGNQAQVTFTDTD